MRIDEIFSFEKGVLQSSKCVPGDFDFITASSEWKTHNEYTHDCEALIFAAAASGSLGRTHYVNGKFVSSDLCFIITPKDQKNLPVDLKFYHILFNELKDEIVRNTKAGTSKEAIGLNSFGKYELPYFDIDTQIEIKNLFVNSEEIKSSLTTELNKQVGLVKKLRQQLLQDAVQGKLVEQNKKDEPASELLKKIKAEKEKLIAEKKLKKEKEKLIVNQEDVPFELPKNWSWCNLGELAILNARIGWKGLNASEYKKEGPLFLSVHSLNYGDYVDYSQAFHISQERYDESPEIMLKDNDILICKDGAGIGKLGIIKDLKEQATTNSSLLVIRCFNNLNVKFIYYYLISGHFQNIVQARIMGATTPHLYQRDLVHFYVALPPLAVQNRIVQKVEELMQYCNELETSIKQSEAQNEKLLQQVLREALRKEPLVSV
jgi:type I restriction enzyme, S subunit